MEKLKALESDTKFCLLEGRLVEMQKIVVFIRKISFYNFINFLKI